jgi:pimeloyl-ACP methyl ester carboxylesterase
MLQEDAIVFGSSARLVGIVTNASLQTQRAATTGIVLLNAGLVHRVGPNRIYVGLARELAAQGYTCLRFDHSGIGDSPAAADDRPFGERFIDEAREAMDWLGRHRACEQFVLVGLCSGTLTAFNTARGDARVTGLILLTALLQDPATVPPEVVAEASDRRVTRSYTTAKATSQSAWKRVFTGQANYRNALRTAARVVARRTRRRAVDPDVARVVGDIAALVRRGVGILFVFAEPTTVLEYFRMTLEHAVARLRPRDRVEVIVIKRSDHTFSRISDQKRVMAAVGGWLAGWSAKT